MRLRFVRKQIGSCSKFAQWEFSMGITTCLPTSDLGLSTHCISLTSFGI